MPTKGEAALSTCDAEALNAFGIETFGGGEADACKLHPARRLVELDAHRCRKDALVAHVEKLRKHEVSFDERLLKRGRATERPSSYEETLHTLSLAYAEGGDHPRRGCL